MKPIHIKNFLPQDLNIFLYNYCILKYSNPDFVKVDNQTRSIISCYADHAMETILDMSTPVIEQNVGKKLWPGNTFFRIYDKGSDLPIHLDRGVCEYTVAYCIGADPWDKPYKIYVGEHSEDSSYRYFNEKGEYKPMKINYEINQLPNEAIIFQGQDIPHWREYCEHDHFLSVFMHYVDQDGPYAHLKYDGRESLGINKD